MINGYELLGEWQDSKEVAIGMQNFVTLGKAFFPQYFHPLWRQTCWMS
jgi:hypothetical protein